jgi:hypothetical protein
VQIPYWLSKTPERPRGNINVVNNGRVQQLSWCNNGRGPANGGMKHHPTGETGTLVNSLWIFNRSPAHEVQQLRAGACTDFATVLDQHLQYGQQMSNYKPSALAQGSTLNPTIAM